MNKKTLVLGASSNANRYSNLAIKKLIANGFVVSALGKYEGVVAGVQIYTVKKYFKNIDTITLYLSKENQQDYYQYIIKLNPVRVLFNPGTENVELENLLKQHNIAFEKACTLVLLSMGVY